MTALLADAWRLSVGTLTAIAVRPPAAVDRRRAGLAMVLAPLAVLPLGVVVAALVTAGVRVELPDAVVALLAVGALALGSRALHLDGLADTADGLAASYDRDRSLHVMRSGTSGPAGVVAVVLVLGLQAAALAGMVAQAGARAAVPAGVCVCASRAVLGLTCARGVAGARSDGLGAPYAGSVPLPAAALVLLAGAAAVGAGAAWIGGAWWRGPLAVVVAALVVRLLVSRASRRLGGVTGDVYGAAIELALATLLVVLSAGRPA